MTKSSGLNNDYKLALGALIIETSKLESGLTSIIAALARMDILEALVLVHPAPFAQKLDMLRALYRLHFPDRDDPNYAPIKTILDRIKDVSEFRNSIVHALWRVGDDGVPQAVRFQRRGELKRSQLPAPIEKVRECTLEAIDLAGSLETLAQSYRELTKLSLEQKE